MIEPQLNGENNSPEMQKDSKEIEYQKQAGDNDYKNSIPIKGVNRGHLFPCSHAHDLDTQKSTFTLTNIVPQVVSFNNGRWKKMECKVQTTLKLNCKDANDQIKAYVVTGAVPSNNNTLKNRVNIPDLMWTAYCCYNNNLKQWVAQAHWGENQKEDNKTLPSNTLAELYDMLDRHYGGGGDVQVFPDQCPKGDILRELLLKDGDVHDHSVYYNDCVYSSVGVKVEKFSDVPQCQNFFLEGTTPNLTGILVDGTVQNQNRYKPICQLFNNIYRFATLYDTTNRIPVFSAYTFTGPPTDPRPHQPWMIEPQVGLMFSHIT
eukprot:XP_014044337.1 PREDICTED: endonuclease domain-containing 1 protein-like [Salmo salar]